MDKKPNREFIISLEQLNQLIGLVGEIPHKYGKAIENLIVNSVRPVNPSVEPKPEKQENGSESTGVRSADPV